MKDAQTLDLAPRVIVEDEPETSSINQPITIPLKPPADPSAEQRMRAMEVSGALDFWDRPEEDIYTLDDGEPV